MRVLTVTLMSWSILRLLCEKLVIPLKQERLVILGISGSLRKQSSNSRLLSFIGERITSSGSEFRLYEGMANLPHFNPDLDVDDKIMHEAVREWRNELSAADAVIVCTPEYANGVPGSLKNAFDWIVSSGQMIDKPTAVISASPNQEGGAIALESLTRTLRMINASIPDEASIAVPFIGSKFAPDGRLKDENTMSRLDTLVRALVEDVRSIN